MNNETNAPVWRVDNADDPSESKQIENPTSDLKYGDYFPSGELEKLMAENQTLRAAQKSCEDCDGPTLAKFQELERENQRLRDARIEDESTIILLRGMLKEAQDGNQILQTQRDQWKACCKSFHDFVCSEIVVGNPDRYVRIKELVAAFDKLNTP